jgi:hypothetical protein
MMGRDHGEEIVAAVVAEQERIIKMLDHWPDTAFAHREPTTYEWRQGYDAAIFDVGRQIEAARAQLLGREGAR